MHKALDPRLPEVKEESKKIEDFCISGDIFLSTLMFDYCETCPNCWYSIPIIIDPHEHNKYEVTCPVCGKPFMLCTICHDDQEETGCGSCDWCAGRGCYRQKK